MNVLATTAIRPAAPVSTRPVAPAALPDPKPSEAVSGDGRKAGGKATKPSNLLDVKSLLAAQEADGGKKDGVNQELTDEEKRVVAEMKARDAEVRRHEEAHARVGGQYAGAPSYQYDQGPDGNKYAVSGEVPIDVAPIPGDPAATIRKMDVVKRAALAPAEPSSQDRAVAAKAEQEKIKARAEQLELKREETTASNGAGKTEANGPTSSNGATADPAVGATSATGPQSPSSGPQQTDSGFTIAASAYSTATATTTQPIQQLFGLVA